MRAVTLEATLHTRKVGTRLEPLRLFDAGVAPHAVDPTTAMPCVAEHDVGAAHRRSARSFLPLATGVAVAALLLRAFAYLVATRAGAVSCTDSRCAGIVTCLASEPAADVSPVGEPKLLVPAASHGGQQSGGGNQGNAARLGPFSETHN